MRTGELCAAVVLMLLLVPLAAVAGDEDRIWPTVERASPERRAHAPEPVKLKKARSAERPAEPIPEPSSLLLFAAGMVVAARSLRNRKTISGHRS